MRVRGRGEVTVAAYGVGDAEHLVEKELRALWTDGRIRVGEIARCGPSRIVEDFRVGYVLEGTITIEATGAEAAASAAFRRLRAMLAGSRYQRTEWAPVSAGAHSTSVSIPLARDEPAFLVMNWIFAASKKSTCRSEYL